ncbi:C6 zinc finger domain protein [Apiospora rasikravindrae]|uniref:C6 zinc finger domain protein n=1 Tax=Apiospora rasikravindrae TaxID=990691 RepID=A0ABR1RYP4_9PEZI
MNKISKACEPCRARKIRCNGSRPACQNCHADPSQCVYRAKARIRKSLKNPDRINATLPRRDAGPSDLTRPAAGADYNAASDRGLPSGDEGGVASPASDGHVMTGPSSEKPMAQQRCQSDPIHIDGGVTETHLAPTNFDSSQLFYGPSSNFAFLQQVHRGILSKVSHSQPQYGRHRGADRSGLDTFMQRSIFFGTPLRVDVEAIRSSRVQLQQIPFDQAKEFLENFKISSYSRMSFYSIPELDDLLRQLYHADDLIPPQTKTCFLAMLAIGALWSEHTDLAETLYIQAKREAVVFDDAVTLQMLQFSLLMSDYQINMGRPNSTYLHLGVACRKAFALGLHKDGPSLRNGEGNLAKHRNTLWLLYFYETCQALTLGRRASMSISDISCPFPTDPPFVANLCHIAKIMEDGAKLIYGRKSESLRQLYVTAEGIYAQLRRFAESCDIASAHSSQTQSPAEAIETLTLHNCYYLGVILTFRPFLIANYAMRFGKYQRDNGEMWLRQACRYATDAAQDSIIFMSSIVPRIAICKVRLPLPLSLFQFTPTGWRLTTPQYHRYQAFFIECSCAVLIYDILCQPSKYTYNIEYINISLQTLSSMIADEPVTSAINSIKRVLRTIEDSISSQGHGAGASPAESATTPNSRGQASAAATPNSGAQNHYSSIQFPSLDHLTQNGAEQMIFLTERNYPQPTAARAAPMGPYATAAPGNGFGPDPSFMNAAPNFNLDVMTTDLFNFFPMDVTTPLDFTPRSDGG